MASSLWIEPGSFVWTGSRKIFRFRYGSIKLNHHEKKYFQEYDQGIIVDKHISRYDIHLGGGMNFAEN